METSHPTNTAYLISLLFSLVGKVPIYRAVGLGSIPGRTSTQGHKMIEKVLPLLNICKYG